MGGANLTLGVDPDLHNCGFAFVTPKRVLYAGCVTVPRDLKGAEAAAELARNFAAMLELVPHVPDVTIVEGQVLYTGPKKHKRPQDIVHLANAAGACLGAAYARFPSTVGILPRPSDWKGSVPKGVKQGRILRNAGIEEFMANEDEALPCEIPEWGSHIRKAQWTHVIDALGLAQWGLTAYRVRRALRRADAGADGR